ncbi:DUF2232 domain-containing protein [bacterium]|nr:DUF2232 domain-containing protein [bacterium]
MNALFALGILAIVFGLLVVVANRAIWWGLKSGRSLLYCVTFSTLVLIGVYIFTVIIARLVFHQDVVGLWQQEFEMSLQATVAMYVELGLETTEIERSARLIRVLFLQGATGWILVLTIALSLSSYLVQRKVAKHLLGIMAPLPAFSQWRICEKLIWLLMAAMFLVLLGSRGITWAAWMGLNSTIVIGCLYFMAGLAIVQFFMEKRNIARAFKFLLIFFLLFFPVLVLCIALAGIFDTWWDWRKLRAPKQKQE